MKLVPNKQTALDALTKMLLKGRREAIFFALLFNCIPYFSFLSSVTIALVTLRQGVKEGAFVALVTMLPAVMVAAYQGSVLLGLAQGGATFGVAWFLAFVLNYRRSWASVFFSASMLALLIGIMVHTITPNHVAESKRVLQDIFNVLQEKGQLKYDDALMKDNINWFADYFLGTQLAISTLIALFNLGLARYMQSNVFYPGGFTREFLFFRLTPDIAFLFVACLVGLLLDSAIAKMFIMVSALPLVFSGISLMHWRVRRWLKGRLLVLLPSYFLLIAFPFTFIPLMVVGFADMWFDFRNVKAPTDAPS